MGIRERKLQTKIINYIRKRGGVAYNTTVTLGLATKPTAGIYTTNPTYKQGYDQAISSVRRYSITRGIPDILACISGKFIAIEVKVGSNKATAMQVAQCSKIALAGGTAYVAYDLDSVKLLMEGV